MSFDLRSTTVINHDRHAPLRVEVGDARAWIEEMLRDVTDSGLFASLSGSAAKVYQVLLLAANPTSPDRIACESMDAIGTRAGVSLSAVYIAVRELENMRLIERRARGGGANTTLFQILSVVPQASHNPRATPDSIQRSARHAEAPASAGRFAPTATPEVARTNPHPGPAPGQHPPPVSRFQNLEGVQKMEGLQNLESGGVGADSARSEFSSSSEKTKDKNSCSSSIPIALDGKDAEAVRLLQAEGVRGKALERLASYGAARVRDAIESADEHERCKIARWLPVSDAQAAKWRAEGKKIGTRHGYIYSFLTEEYPLFGPVEARRKRERMAAAIEKLARDIQPACGNDAGTAKVKAATALKQGLVTCEEVERLPLDRVLLVWNERASNTGRTGVRT